MRIGILGANSQIAKDLILSFSASRPSFDLVLFSRRPAELDTGMALRGIAKKYPSFEYEDFGGPNKFDAIINFVGIGDPSQTATMGSSILDVTLAYDQLALAYIKENPSCRYLFLSSGAAYGDVFNEPVTKNTKAAVPINQLNAHDWYSVAKLYAECCHRALSSYSIVDIRVFNYFSHTQDISSRFLMTDIIRAIKSNEVLMVGPENIIRDFFGPDDFCLLVTCILNAPPLNAVIDCYTKEPIDKFSLLEVMKSEFGLQYQFTNEPVSVNATGLKSQYYSKNHCAEAFGYVPARKSLDVVREQARLVLQK